MLASRKICGDSVEMREMAARICRDYLNGAWKSVTAQNIGFKHISGGLSNWLYHVWLPSDSKKPTSYPTQVLIRIYGQMHGERALEAIITESVIFTLLSERGLGPRLHGVFPGGRIEQYIAARPLKTKELADRRISACVARKMAQVHSMEVPLSKEPRWLWDTMSRWQSTCQKKLQESEVPKSAQFLQDIDFLAELNYLKKIIALQPSRVCFCHNDFQEGNILLHETTENHLLTSPKLVLIVGRWRLSSHWVTRQVTLWGVMLANLPHNGQKILLWVMNYLTMFILHYFEYCSYNYRGFDLANHLLEWVYDYTEPSAPYYKETKDAYPDQEQQLHFIKNYLNELKSNENPESLLSEIKTFSLASHLFWGLWSVVNAGSSQITFGYWEYAVSRLSAYLRLKQELPLNQNQQKQKRKIEDIL